MIGENETQKLMVTVLNYRSQLQRTAISKRRDIDFMKASTDAAGNLIEELNLAIAGGEDQLGLITKTLIDLDKVFPVIDKKVITLPPAKPVNIPVVEK